MLVGIQMLKQKSATNCEEILESFTCRSDFSMTNFDKQDHLACTYPFGG